MKWFLQFITAGVFLFTPSVARELGNQSCKHVVGHFEANVVPPGEERCPSGPARLLYLRAGLGGIQSNYQFVMKGAIPCAAIGGVPTTIFFTVRDGNLRHHHSYHGAIARTEQCNKTRPQLT